MLRGICALFVVIGIQFIVNHFVDAEEWTVKQGDSIQTAIDTIPNGATLMIKKGRYKGNLIINKSVYLKGEDGAIIIGNGEGNVIEIKADNVTIENLTIEKSGKSDNNAGIRVESSKNLIQNNILKNVHYGVYLHKGKHNQIINNQIRGHQGHFSAKGNGIHLFYTKDTKLIGNIIHEVQDGIYFDFAEESTLKENQVEKSRYGYHIMYATKGLLEGNISAKNITGLMIMEAKDFQIANNVVTENLDYRGHGLLIFDSDRINLVSNRVTYNNTGISLQDARDCLITKNIFAGNFIGLDLKDKNERNTMIENNFIGNIVQTKVFTQVEPMDLKGRGNYWDDYNGMDLDGDEIGDIPYESGKLFDKLVEENPTLQFFFESPTIKLWSSIERIFPAFSGEKGMDRYPYIHPVESNENLNKSDAFQQNWVALLLGLLMVSCGMYIFYRGRVS